MSVKEIENELSAKQLAQFKTMLESVQRQLRPAVGKTVRDGRDISVESAADPADCAVNANLREFLFRQAHERHRLLQAADGALERIAQGTFGKCLSCDALISTKRLQAVPWTLYCVECQEKRECGELPVKGEHSTTETFARRLQIGTQDLRRR